MLHHHITEQINKKKTTLKMIKNKYNSRLCEVILSPARTNI